MYGTSLSAGPCEVSYIDLVISKSQLTIKVQNLKATLPAIIFIRNVFHLSLQEQHHQEGAGVQKCYETYKNASTLLYTRTLRECNVVGV